MRRNKGGERGRKGGRDEESEDSRGREDLGNWKKRGGVTATPHPSQDVGKTR